MVVIYRFDCIFTISLPLSPSTEEPPRSTKYYCSHNRSHLQALYPVYLLALHSNVAKPSTNSTLLLPVLEHNHWATSIHLYACVWLPSFSDHWWSRSGNYSELQNFAHVVWLPLLWPAVNRHKARVTTCIAKRLLEGRHEGRGSSTKRDLQRVNGFREVSIRYCEASSKESWDDFWFYPAIDRQNQRHFE